MRKAVSATLLGVGVSVSPLKGSSLFFIDLESCVGAFRVLLKALENTAALLSPLAPQKE